MSTILYNIRNRGAYEYDKTVLNIFQIKNDITRLDKKIISKEDADIKDKVDIINTIFESITKENNRLQEILYIRKKVERLHD